MKIGEAVSGKRQIIYGLPQGALLSTILFNIFINDIFLLNLKGYLQLYADDGAIIYTCQTTEELNTNMQHDLNLIENWFKQNFLFINANKTYYMTFKSDITDLNLTINNVQIKKTMSFKYLGLIIDSNLKWNEHVSFVLSKIRSTSFALAKSRHLINEDTA